MSAQCRQNSRIVYHILFRQDPFGGKWSNELQSCVCEYDTDDEKLCDAEYGAGCQVREEKEVEE